MPFQKKSQIRLTVLSLILVSAIIFYTVRVHSIQIVHASEYNGKINGAASVRTSVLKAPRGEILDCYGRQIAINRDGYNIVFNKAYVKDNINDIILTLINLMQQNGEEWIDELPISQTEPYNYLEGESTSKLIKLLEVAKYATADNCFVLMVEKYGLENYSKEDQRKIMGVRYSMDIGDFSISYPYTFAEDITTELMRKVSESAFLLAGVSVDVVPFREYVDTSLAVNLIGSVGPIYEEEWDEYSKKGYSYNDKVGKSGIEKWGEEYLRGTDGEITYSLDSKGNIISKEVTKEPIAGKTIMLSLDKNLQRAAQNSLENTVKTLQSTGGTATAGAAVVMDIKSGKILCAANYPTYDSKTMSKNYDALVSDSRKPLTNRSFQGVYPIGSTIKPIVAIAAIDNHQFETGELIYCRQKYDHFEDYKPNCMHYHKSINLNDALAKSCNYFFFELGRRVGAIKLTEYYKQFGLGVKTGVEVDDSRGLLYQPKNNTSGDTLQIAIGQLNAFTPLQLASYTTTLANGGTHYRATLIDKIVSYDISTVYEEYKPEVVNTISISNTALTAVKNGMLSVTEEGTGRSALGTYSIKVGGKTGTAQVENKADHSIFIAFAPFDNPEIAISVVLEHGSSGYSTGMVVRDLLDTYFYNSSTPTADTVPFTVLE